MASSAARISGSVGGNANRGDSLGGDAYIGDVLLRHDVIDAEALATARTRAEENGVGLRDVLLATHVVEEEAMVRAFASEMGMPFIPKIEQAEIPDELIDLVPINFAREHHVLPLEERDGSVVVAVADPLDPFPLDDLRALFHKPIEPVASTREAIDDVINRVYERKDSASLAEARQDEEVEELQDIIDQTDEAPVIRWVNDLFYRAVRDRASDIHIEPTDEKVIVRFRIDGRLVQKKEAHKGNLPSIVARVKIEAGLNIAEKRLPQDGRITKKIAGKVVDVRVSTIPTAKGERVVMRLLDKENIMLDLVDLGFAKRDLDLLQHMVSRPNGIVLVTGPTGSGKTTTLYAALNRINTPDKNILTAEDPVEYELRGIGQLHVQAKIGLTFANAMRSFLRQDPDVIMVGEIRDHETADIAIHASLTGHLVLSTLHTNDAPGAITRLIDMKLQPFQISSSLLGVLAQRLVRRLCPHCKEPYTATPEHLIQLGVEMDRVEETLAELRRVAATTVLGRNSEPPEEMELDAGDLVDEPMEDTLAEQTQVRDLNQVQMARSVIVGAEEDTGEHVLAERSMHDAVEAWDHDAAEQVGASSMPTFYRAVGCDQCSFQGYRGRMGIFELMMIDEPVRREILKNSDAKAIQRAARTQGMRTLREDGARQVVAGQTSVEEVLAATQATELETAAE